MKDKEFALDGVKVYVGLFYVAVRLQDNRTFGFGLPSEAFKKNAAGGVQTSWPSF